MSFIAPNMVDSTYVRKSAAFALRVSSEIRLASLKPDQSILPAPYGLRLVVQRGAQRVYQIGAGSVSVA